ncbi:MAG: type and secretion system protein [Schlesneria sp.]|nr:type and secretion system protein [Schlesneria sp.]
MNGLRLSLTGLILSAATSTAMAQSYATPSVVMPGYRTVGTVDRAALGPGHPESAVAPNGVRIQHPTQIEAELKVLAEQLATAGLSDEARVLGALEGRIHEVHFNRLMLAHQQQPADVAKTQISLKIQLIEVIQTPQTDLAIDMLFDRPPKSRSSTQPNLTQILASDKVETWLKEVVTTGHLKPASQLQSMTLAGRSTQFRFGRKLGNVGVTDSNANSSVSDGLFSEAVALSDDSKFAGTVLVAKTEMLPGDLIGLTVLAENREPSPSGTDKVRIQTNVDLRTGQTLVLMGLQTYSMQTEVTRIPKLGDIPMMGRLFSSRRSTQVVTDRLLTITPEIVRPQADGISSNRIVQPTAHSTSSR